MRTALFLLIFSLIPILIQAQFHFPVFPDLEGMELIENVVESYKPETVLDYGEARDLMYGVIYNEQDSVEGVYSGHRLYLPPNTDPSSFLYMNGAGDGINAEHTYPRSKGADEDSGNAFSDMHHLYPTRSGVNSARGNFPFGDIADDETTMWYYQNEVLTSPPSSNIDSYSERVEGVFEPREQHKGNLARAVFYFFTMYNQEALEADPDYFELQRKTLCEWHGLDPIDSLEWIRTFLIAEEQSGKANPFILDCSLAQRIYCDDVQIDCPDFPIFSSNDEAQKPPEALIYPNPVTENLSILAKGSNSLKVVDILGRTVLERLFLDSVELDFSAFRTGNYFIMIGGQVYKVLKV